ncbi:MAG: beta-ketoacyl synthase N-terminal-like domain-containing protein [Prevotella sp.]
MVSCIAHNIVSPIAFGSESNYMAVKRGDSLLRLHEDRWNLSEPFVASLFNEGEIEERFKGLAGARSSEYTRFEQLAILSIADAIAQTGLDLSGGDVAFVLSTTKGNVEMLDETIYPHLPRERVLPEKSAEVVAQFFGITSTPVVVSNACISGVCALIVAMRLLRSGKYRHAIVCGCDVQSKFIVSGFQSFKALSMEQCRPFSKNRDGLNLGEAAATMILSSETDQGMKLIRGAIRNDANHISGPSRTGEGSFRALSCAVGKMPLDELAFVNVHGTATLYNDEMESIALHREGIDDAEIPVNSLKGIFGHTMGAAGVLECIVSMEALAHGEVLPTHGFDELGVSYEVNVTKSLSLTDKQCFVKLLSGFGGCNAALLVGKSDVCEPEGRHKASSFETLHTVTITPGSVCVDGEMLVEKADAATMLTKLYKEYVGDYPKYYKMDPLSRLGFVATELLVKPSGLSSAELEHCAVAFAGSRGSWADDCKHQATIADENDFFPSPAVFVYTLPNIVTGEIAIRHKIYGETMFYYLSEEHSDQTWQLLELSFDDPQTNMVIGGWLDYTDENDYKAEIRIIKLRIKN